MGQGRRIALVAALVAGLVATLGGLAPAASAGTLTASFAPVADSYVSSANATTNYGTATVLREVSSGDVRRGFLRFTVSGLTAPVSAVTLRVYAATGHPTGFTAGRVSNTTWGETTITNSTAPAISSTVAGTSGALTAGTWVDVPLTGIVTGNGTFSIGLKATAPNSTTVLDLGSRESATPPQLLVTTTDTTAPALTLTKPANGGWSKAAAVAYGGAAGNASGDGTQIGLAVYQGAAATGSPVQSLSTTRTTSTWALTAPALADGTYTAVASQSDNHGNAGTASSTFAIDTVAPLVSLTAPAGGARLNTTSVLLSGGAGTQPGDPATATVRIYAGSTATGTPVQTLTATATLGAWSVASGVLAAGTYTAQAQQTDAAGNSATSTAATFTIDTTAPVVSLTAPASGATLATATPAISGAAGTATGDATTVSVDVFAGATASGSPVQTLTATRSGSSWSVAPAPLADGTYTVRARQSDSAGNTGSSSAVTFTIDRTAPAVTLTTPAAGASVATSGVAYAGAAGAAAGDGASVTVKVYAGTAATGTALKTLTATRSGGAWTTTGPALADGTYTAVAQQADAVGNSGSSGAPTFTIDTAAPSPAVADPASGAALQSSPAAISGSAGAAPGDAVSVSVELFAGTSATGSPLETLTATRSGSSWSVAPAPLADGTYTVRARQSDSAGNTGTSAAVTFAVDGVSPVPSLTAPAAGAVLGTATPPLAGTAGTAPGDAATIHVRVYAGASATGQPLQSLTTPATLGAWTATPAALADGTYTVVAEQSDAAGNSAASAPLTFSVDTTAPAPAIGAPAAGAWSASSGVALSGTAGTDPGDAGELAIELYAGTSASGAPVQTLPATQAGGAWSVSAAGLADGPYTAVARQADAAGNSGASAPVTFTVDTTAPAPAVTTPAAGATLGSTTPALGGVAGAAAGDDATVTVQLYAGAQAAGTPLQTLTPARTGATWSATPESLADQATYTVVVRQSDAAGNAATSAPVTFAVDTSVPQIAISAPADGASIATATPVLSGAAGTRPIDGDVTVQLFAGATAGGTPVQVLAGTREGGSWTAAPAALADGTYTAVAEQADTLGHTAQSAPVTFTVDTVAPVVTLTEPAPGAWATVATPALGGAAGSQPGDAATVEVRIHQGATLAGPLVTSLTAQAALGSWSALAPSLADGTYTVQARQDDAAGHSAQSAAVTFSVDTAGPAVAVTAPADGASLAATPAITGLGGEANGDDATVAVGVYAGSAAAGSPVRSASVPVISGGWSWTPAGLADGTYTVRALQGDAAGHGGASAPVTFSIDSAAPAVTLTAPADGAALATATPALSGGAGTAAGDGPVTLELYAGGSVAGSPAQTVPATVAGASWSATPVALADGTWTARAVQDDATGNHATSAAVTFSVDTVAPAVTVASPADGTTLAVSPPSLSGSAGDAPGDGATVTVELFAGAGTGGSPVQTLTAARTGATWAAESAPLADGQYTVRARQADAAGHVTTSSPATFRVDTAAPAPTLTQPGSLQTVSGTIALAGTAGAATGDGQDVTVKVYADPAQSPVRTVTATRSGTAWSTTTPALPDATYTIKVEQSDAAGNTGISAGTVIRAGLSYQDSVLADGPRGYWRLGETSGTTAADLGSAANPGTYQGGFTQGAAGAITGDANRAVTLNGTSGNVNLGDPANDSLDLGTGDFSIELWMKTTVNNSQSVIGKQGASGAYWQLLVTNAAGQVGKIRASFSDGTTLRQGYSSVRVDDGAWHHVVVSFTRATGMDIYVDGDRSTKAGALTASLSNTAALQIGKVTGFPYFNGTLDDVAIYPTALSAARVTSHLAASLGPDVSGPSPSITGPASTTNDAQPTFAGRLSTAPGDTAAATVKVYAGAAATGSPLQTLPVAAADGAVWSVNASAQLADGQYTAVVTQRDAAGNSGSASRTFTIARPAASAPDYRASVLADNPAGYWRLGENGGVAAGDQTTGNDAGLISGGPAWTTGAVQGDDDRALTFDGVDDQVSLGDPAGGGLDLGSGDFTVEAWMRTTVNGGQSVLGKQGSGALWNLLVTNAVGRAGTLRFTFSNGTTTRQWFSPRRVDDGAWHYVAVSFRRSAPETVWVDGVAASLNSLALGGSLDNDAPLTLGKVTGYAPFNGSLDEVAVYRSALSADRIAAHYAEGTRAEGSAPAVTLGAPATGSSTSDATPRYSGTSGIAAGDLPSIAVEIYSGGSVGGTPLRTITAAAGRDGAWSIEDGTELAPGTYTARAVQRDTSGTTSASTPATFTVQSPGPPDTTSPALIAAGDIASCGVNGDEQTAALLGQLTGDIQTLGDNAYDHGSASDWSCFDSSWGPFKSRIHPSPGDHDYETAAAAAYFSYFGAVAGDPSKGYYSYDLGTWHIVVANLTCEFVTGGCAAGSPQETWVRADLAAHPGACTLAVVGEPLQSSGMVHGNEAGPYDIWKALYQGGVDVVLSADDHDYERFAPATPERALDLAGGIRQFTVGTGGYSTYPVGPAQDLSEVRQQGTWGVLRLVLRPGGYDWRFHAAAGATFTDVGSSACH